jgi:hypothetical protein
MLSLPHSPTSGGRELHRGVLYQQCSLLYYILMRLADHPDLEIKLESLEDATIRYSPAETLAETIELLQCKKHESGRGGEANAGLSVDDLWTPGSFDFNDFREWVMSEREGVMVSRVLAEEPDTFYTALLFGRPGQRLRSYIPATLADAVPLRFVNPQWLRGFAPDYRHARDPAGTPKTAFASEEVRKRVRIVPTVAPRELWWACRIYLGEHFRVSHHKIEVLLNKLARMFLEASATQSSFRGKDLLAEILSSRADRGQWKPGEEFIEASNPRLSEPMRGGPLRYADFLHNRFATRPEFEIAWEAICRPGALVAVNGAVGTGKTTLCRYLIYRFLAEHPGNRAFFLGVTPSVRLSDEKSFLLQDIHRDVLFIIDDEHLAVEEVAELIQAVSDAGFGGGAAVRLVVSSKINYGRTETLARGRASGELRRAVHVPLPNKSQDAVINLVEQLRYLTGLATPLSNQQLAALSDGVPGLALIIARSTAGLGRAGSRTTILNRNTLKAHLAQWVTTSIGADQGVSFESEIAPVFILGAFGLSIPADFSPHLSALALAGFVEEDEGTGNFHLTSLNLGFLFQEQYKDSVESVLSSYVKNHPERLVQAILQAAQWKEALGALDHFLEPRLATLMDVLADPGVTLDKWTNVLTAVLGVSRALVVRIFRSWIMPSRRPNEWFFRDMIARASSAREVARFLNIIRSLDRHVGVVRGLIERCWGDHETRLLQLLFELPPCELDQVAFTVHALRRLSQPVATRVYEVFVASGVQDAKLAAMAEQKNQLLQLLRYVEELRSVDRAGAYAVLERYLEPAVFVDAVLSRSARLQLTTGLLQRLSRVHPRWAGAVLRTLWSGHAWHVRDLLESEPHLDMVVQALYTWSRIHRPTAIRAAFAIVGHLRKQIHEEGRYDVVGARIDTVRRSLSVRLAEQLCADIDKERMRELVAGERRYVDTVGKFLLSCAETCSELGAWLEERLDYRELLVVARAPRLRDLVILIRGFLAAAVGVRSARLKERLLDDIDTIQTFKMRWNETRTLSEVGFGLVALTRTPLATTEVVRLLGFLNVSEFSNDLTIRFKKTDDLLHVANGLYGVAGFNPQLARRFLIDYVDRVLKTDERSPGVPPPVAAPQAGMETAFGRSRNLVELGSLLHVAAAVYPAAARRLAVSLSPDILAQIAVEEGNLGRLVVFVGGLSNASRALGRAVAHRLAEPDIWRRQYEQNDVLQNVVHYCRVLGQVSALAAARFMEFVYDHYAQEIEEWLRVEASVPVLASWLRSALRRPDAVGKRAKIVSLLVEAAESDDYFWNLLEATEALVEMGELPQARDLAQRTLSEAGQVRGLRKLADLVVLINRAVNIGRGLEWPELVVGILRSLSDWPLALKFVSEHDHIVQAFLIALGRLEPSLAGSESGSRFLAKREFVLSRIAEEERGVSNIISLILVGVPIGEIVDAMRAIDLGHTPAWELGLIRVLFTDLAGGSTDTIRQCWDIDRVVWEGLIKEGLCPDASNIEFGLTLRLAEIVCPGAVAVRAVREAQIERQDDESSAPRRWILEEAGKWRGLSGKTYYLWALLQQTFLRPMYLPWDRDVETAADSEAFEQSYVRDLSALITS